MLNNDNEEGRKMVEQCYKLSKTVVNPIIDWDNSEVWEFIKEYDIPYCKLYDEGWLYRLPDGIERTKNK